MNAMPTWDAFMTPVLRLQSDGAERQLREIVASVSDAVGLTREQRGELLGSGQAVATNRIGWACSYLYRVDALLRPRRGIYTISDLGKRLLAEHPRGISELELRAFAREGDEWWLSRGGHREGTVPTDDSPAPSAMPLDPVEMIAQGVEMIDTSVRAELLERLAGQAPAFFEHTVVDLLVAMGYGGSGGRAEATRLVRDGGIDGVIDQDVLGLDKVYIQAKRYAKDSSVQRPEVQAFVGALSGKADRGVFLTTGRFSAGAIEYAERDARARIILIDGNRLTDLMVRYRVGVQVKQSVHIVAIDEDFFE